MPYTTETADVGGTDRSIDLACMRSLLGGALA
jgi:hypothetical protein